jgi:hypothetical protein
LAGRAISPCGSRRSSSATRTPVQCAGARVDSCRSRRDASCAHRSRCRSPRCSSACVRSPCGTERRKRSTTRLDQTAYHACSCRGTSPLRLHSLKAGCVNCCAASVRAGASPHAGAVFRAGGSRLSGPLRRTASDARTVA